MTTYHDIHSKITTHLEASSFVNTVSKGSIFKIDTKKTTMFPLSHIMIDNVAYEGNVLIYNVSVLAMDIVPDHDGEIDVTDYIHNTQLSVLVNLLESVRRGDMWSNNLHLVSDSVTIEPWEDRFENALAGWTASFSLAIANSAVIC